MLALALESDRQELLHATLSVAVLAIGIRSGCEDQAAATVANELPKLLHEPRAEAVGAHVAQDDGVLAREQAGIVKQVFRRGHGHANALNGERFGEIARAVLTPLDIQHVRTRLHQDVLGKHVITRHLVAFGAHS